jgi:hypothetical protein
VWSILSPAVVWGIGIGIAVTPLTAAVLAEVSDADLGEASAINDTAARVGSVVVIALVLLPIGAGAAASLSNALDHREYHSKWKQYQASRARDVRERLQVERHQKQHPVHSECHAGRDEQCTGERPPTHAVRVAPVGSRHDAQP